MLSYAIKWEREGPGWAGTWVNEEGEAGDGDELTVCRQADLTGEWQWSISYYDGIMTELMGGGLPTAAAAKRRAAAVYRALEDTRHEG